VKTRAIILAGGEGTRLGVLTAKRTKPAVPFAGKYRIIDFTLSNCVNSDLFDVMIIAQYRPQSLIEHLGSGAPWDLNRDFTGGIRIYTPYKSQTAGWFSGTADAVQQNFRFIKRSDPDLILILSGDHIYSMDYSALIRYHLNNQADLTMATIRVPIEEASRFGIVGVDADHRVTSFVEKPADPPSNLANMGVYLFNRDVLDDTLWRDHLRKDSSHDFGKDALPELVHNGARVFAYPYDGYWVDVGTVNTYWEAHMELLKTPPSINLHNRSWIMHTRTEERPPVMLHKNSIVADSMICDGCTIESGAQVINSILSPGVYVHSGAVIREAILFTDCVVEKNASITRAILDKRVLVGENARIGDITPGDIKITMVGKNSIVPPHSIIEAGGILGTDLIASDYTKKTVKSDETLITRRQSYEF
jgi:glucose-1-phosphate adenylyltransferase